MPEKQEIPKFNHSESSAMSCGPNGKCLLQGGHAFTYAEFDKKTKRYVPEPKFINPKAVSENEMGELLNKILIAQADLMKMWSEAQTKILDNIDLFVKKA